jgi:RNA polymerase sigma-70 factor (ECF subfamily)
VDYKKLNDETLLRLIVHGNEQALSELFDRYHRLVFSIGLNALGDPQVAEEITQDVFVRVWERAATYQSEQGKVITWLGRIARNRSIDIYRQRSIRPEHNSLSWDGLLNIDLDGAPNVESSFELADLQRRVRQALAGIPAEQRQALAMAYFQGLSHQEIANALGQPLGTIKTRIRLGMLKLKTMLEE